MIRVGITGESGFIGTYVKFYFEKVSKGVHIVSIPRKAFEDIEELTRLVSPCDALIHLAGDNQGSDEEVFAANAGLAAKLVEACRKASKKPHILFASSIYADTPERLPKGRSHVFGAAKKQAEDILLSWGRESGARVSIFKLPHVFGEFAKPNRNSAVATFCHQLVRGEASNVDKSGSVDLVYVGDVATCMHEALKKRRGGVISLKSNRMKVTALYKLLKGFAEKYQKGAVPKIHRTIELELFLTLHAHFLRYYGERIQGDQK